MCLIYYIKNYNGYSILHSEFATLRPILKTTHSTLYPVYIVPAIHCGPYSLYIVACKHSTLFPVPMLHCDLYDGLYILYIVACN